MENSGLYYSRFTPQCPLSFNSVVTLRPTLKSCLFPIHQPGEIKTSYEPPTGRNFFFLQFLCLKR